MARSYSMEVAILFCLPAVIMISATTTIPTTTLNSTVLHKAGNQSQAISVLTRNVSNGPSSTRSKTLTSSIPTQTVTTAKTLSSSSNNKPASSLLRSTNSVTGNFSAVSLAATVTSNSTPTTTTLSSSPNNKPASSLHSSTNSVTGKFSTVFLAATVTSNSTLKSLPTTTTLSSSSTDKSSSTLHPSTNSVTGKSNITSPLLTVTPISTPMPATTNISPVTTSRMANSSQPVDNTTTEPSICDGSSCPRKICTDLGKHFNCSCAPGFSGDNCSVNINECLSNPCFNNATCIDGNNSYSCQCDIGFYGPDCIEDECNKTECKQNGSCFHLPTGSAGCHCPSGYAGNYCELDLCVNVSCQNNGTCEHHPSGDLVCRCQPGYTGHDCEAGIDDCQGVVCHNGGTCVDSHVSFSCVCPPGWSGKNCSEDINECSSNSCDKNFICLNNPGNFNCSCLPPNKEHHGACLEPTLLPTPYGESHKGDDDLLGPLYLPGGIPYGNQTYHVAYVSLNGFLTLGRPCHLINPPLYQNETATVCPGPIVAPLWTDLDFSGNGSVSLMELRDYETNLNNLSRKADVTGAFSASYALVVTWLGVSPYPAYEYADVETATFQAALMTNGSATYLLINYDIIDMQHANWRPIRTGYADPLTLDFKFINVDNGTTVKERVDRSGTGSGTGYDCLALNHSLAFSPLAAPVPCPCVRRAAEKNTNFTSKTDCFLSIAKTNGLQSLCCYHSVTGVLLEERSYPYPLNSSLEEFRSKCCDDKAPPGLCQLFYRHVERKECLAPTPFLGSQLPTTWNVTTSDWTHDFNLSNAKIRVQSSLHNDSTYRLENGTFTWTSPADTGPVTFQFNISSGNETYIYEPRVLLCPCKSQTECDSVLLDLTGWPQSMGSYLSLPCNCQPGESGDRCQFSDEVLSNRLKCFPGSPDGAKTCRCPSMLQGNGIKCYDIDQCRHGHIKCAEVCVNDAGRAYCGCQRGFHMEDGHCQDINECQTNKCPGGKQSVCTNIPGSYSCRCQPGYRGDNCTYQVQYVYGGQLEIRQSPGAFWNPGLAIRGSPEFTGLAKKLENLLSEEFGSIKGFVSVTVLRFQNVISPRPKRDAEPGGFLKATYTVDFSTPITPITDILLVQTFTSGFQKCASPYCLYGNNSMGILLVKSGSYVTDKFDLCQSEETNDCHKPSTTCSSKAGQFQCICLPGYQSWETFPTVCIDVDECVSQSLTSLCGAKASNCRNVPGSYDCQCAPGYRKAADGKCSEPSYCHSSPCKEDATCVELPTGFACQCPGDDCKKKDPEVEDMRTLAAALGGILGALCLILVLLLCYVSRQRKKEKMLRAEERKARLESGYEMTTLPKSSEQDYSVLAAHQEDHKAKHRRLSYNRLSKEEKDLVGNLVTSEAAAQIHNGHNPGFLSDGQSEVSNAEGSSAGPYEELSSRF